MKVKRWLPLVLLALCLAVGLARSKRSVPKVPTVDALVAQGAEAERHLDLALAEQRYREALAQAPASQPALIALATLYSNMERCDLAAPLLGQLLADREHRLASWPLPLLRGFAAEGDEGYAKARKAVELSQLAWPNSRTLAEDLAEITLHHHSHVDNGDLTDAHRKELEAMLAEAAARGSKGWRYHLLNGQLQVTIGHYEDALQAFNQGLADPTLPVGWERLTIETNLGLLALHRGDADVARKRLDAALQTYANLPGYHRLRGRPYRETFAIVRRAYLGDKTSLDTLKTYSEEQRRTTSQGHVPFRVKGVDLVQRFYESLKKGDFARSDELAERIRNSLPFAHTCATGRLYAPTVLCATYLEVGNEAALRGQRAMALNYFKKAYALCPKDEVVLSALAGLKNGSKGSSEPSTGRSQDVSLPTLPPSAHP